MSADPSIVAVLTGDIIKSTSLSLPERDALFIALKAGSNAMRAFQEAAPPFERFSGDSWQLLLTQPQFALRACLMLRAFIRRESKSFETRISVGVGTIEPLSSEGLGASDGMAFQVSGRGLSALNSDQRFTINTDDLTAFILADEISHHWTQAQARVVALALATPRFTHESLSSALGITRQSVGKHLKAAGAPAIFLTLDEIETQRSL